MLKQRAAALLAALALLLLTGCQNLMRVSEFDATTYVKGLLDETYRGVCAEEFLALVESSEADVEKSHRENINAEYTDRLTHYFEIDDTYITRETRDALKDILRAVYARARYEVKGSGRMDDTRYWVEVSVTPMTFFADVYRDDFTTFAAAFNKSHPPLTDEQRAAMSESQAERHRSSYEDDWAAGLVALFESRLGTIAYAETVTQLVLLYPDSEDNLYTISNEDFYNLDKLVLLYN